MGEVNEKRCTKCGEVKDTSEFHKMKNGKDGLRSICKECRKKSSKKYREENKEKIVESGRIYREENKEKIVQRKKKYVITKKHGITIEQRSEILKLQNNACAICGISFTKLSSKEIHTDHCHTTNVVRGILCRSCNHLLGHAKDDITILKHAIKYIEKSTFKHNNMENFQHVN